MRRITDTLLARWLLIIAVVILVAMPFHAVITVGLSSLFGHYTVLRLWKEVLLLVGVGISIVLLIRDQRFRESLWSNRFTRPIIILISLYVVLHILLSGVALLRDDVTLKALGYGVISNLRFLGFFVICLLAVSYHASWIKQHWQQVLLWPAGIVIAFGLLQMFVLPVDFLKHIGYGSDTIAPYIAVDQKVEYARIQSTLRGPNPLGAYLVVIVTAFVGLLVARRLRSWKLPVALAATIIVLYGTYSRSAYIGAVVSVLLISWLLVHSAYVRKVLVISALTVVIAGSGALFVLRDNDHIQNILFHTDEHSLSSKSSNDSRANVMKRGLEDITTQPLGRGPGTAGPASVYNDSQARVSENYFIQIAQEVGVVGLVIFLGICFFVGRALWYVREWNVLPVILLASFVGITIINLMSHAWADDTLAYVWWGFAGLAIGGAVSASNIKGKHGKKTV